MATTRKVKSSSHARGAKRSARTAAGRRAAAKTGTRRKARRAGATKAGRRRVGSSRMGSVVEKGHSKTLDAEYSTSRIRSSSRPAKRPPVRTKLPRKGTTPGGSPASVMPATEISTTDVTAVPPPPGESPQGGAIADTDGLVRDVTGNPAANVMPLESLGTGENEEPFDPPADSNAGSPGADVENPADDSYTQGSLPRPGERRRRKRRNEK